MLDSQPAATGALTPDAIVSAGGLALASATVDASDRLDAFTFTHPCLADRVVVRLVPASTAAAVVTELQLAGFAEAARTDGVARVRRRALGFPAWALVHDPKNARYALEVMKAFTAARKRVATKPGHARDAFAAVAEGLGRAAPHFLPSFWEEAGRAFLVGGAVAMASAAFEKARTAERTHGLPVDEDLRADAFVEFALAGALSVKSLLAWPTELAKAKGADVAYERLYELAVRRTLGGRVPWASLPKDLRTFAKAAKRDPAAEEARYVRAVLGSTALARAPIAFWEGSAASVGLAAREPAVAERLAWMVPESDAEAWIGLLEKWGVLARIVDGTIVNGEGARGLAAWVGRALAAWDDAPALLSALVARLVPRLAAEGVAVPIFGEDVWRVEAVDAYEALAAAGVPMVKGEGGGTFALGVWAGGEGPHVDPVHLAAHPVLSQILRDSVDYCLDEEAFQAIAPGKSAFREPRRAHLVATVARTTAGGLVDLDGALEELEGKVPASTRAEFSDEALPLTTLDVADALARTLAGGVLDELGWPALEAAAAELRGQKADTELTLHAMAPWAVLTDGRRARVLGPGGIEHARDLKLPKGVDADAFRWVGGQLLTVYRDPAADYEYRGVWSGAPKVVFPMEWRYGNDDAATPPWGDGVLCGRRVLRPGDTTLDKHPALCDAEGAWVEEDGALRATDPVTGTLGPADAPAFLAARDGATPDLDTSVYQPQTVAGSPLGAVGQYGWAVFDLGEVEDKEAWIARHAPRALRVPSPGNEGVGVAFHIDGRAIVSGHTLRGLVRWPGSDTPRLVADGGWRELRLLGADGATLAVLDHDDVLPFRAGTPLAVPFGLWHHVRPRDPVASAALRAVDADLARRLLALAADVEMGDEDDDGASVEAVAALAAKVRDVLPITSDALALGIAGVVLHARGLAERLDTYRGGADDADAAEGPTDEALRAALSGLCPHWGDDEGSALLAIRTASAFLGGADVKLHPSDLDWRDWLGRWGALLFVACSPVTTAEERALVEAVLRELAAFARGPTPIRWVRVAAPRTVGWLHWETRWGDREVVAQWTRVDGDNRYVVRHVEDESDDDAVVVDVLEAGPTFRDLSGATVRFERPVSVDSAAILATLAAAPVLPVGDDVYAAVRAATGLDRAASAAVWAGLRQLGRWGNDPLGKPARDALGLKLAEAKAARDQLASLPDEKVREALHAAMVGWDPADVGALPARVGAAWAAVFGVRVPIDPAILTRARQDYPGGDPATGLAELAGIGSAAAFQADGAWVLTATGLDRTGVPADGADSDVFDGEALARGVGALVWVYANTPGEDPLRANLPALHAALTARLANPALLFTVVAADDKPLVKWFTRFDGAPFTPAREKSDDDDTPAPTDTGKDGGGLVATYDGDTVTVAIRPTRLDAAAIEEVGRLVTLDGNYEDATPWRALLLTRGPDLSRMAADRAPGWPQDPRRSVPDLVTDVATHLSLDAPAATLYLQLLTLHAPTKANVLLWNDWKSADYTRAVGPLVEQKLVVEAKRARAGRDHFLPGGWIERRTGALPMEEWKRPFYDPMETALAAVLPSQPFDTLFRAAWARVRAGKGPRYERGRG